MSLVGHGFGIEVLWGSLLDIRVNTDSRSFRDKGAFNNKTTFIHSAGATSKGSSKAEGFVNHGIEVWQLVKDGDGNRVIWVREIFIKFLNDLLESFGIG